MQCCWAGTDRPSITPLPASASLLHSEWEPARQTMAGNTFATGLASSILASILLTAHLASATTALPPPITRLQAYLRLRTDHPSPDYLGAADFLNTTIASLLASATLSQLEYVAGKPIVVATLAGTDPTLPSLLLNSHTDVVPAEASNWLHDPFAADAVTTGASTRIYARGSQDMKCVGMQYLEALSNLLGSGWRPARRIIITFVPDEEIGGVDGLGRLVADAPTWAGMNVGGALDEGLPSPNAGFNVYYGERQPWWLTVEAVSEPGHGALSPETTAPMRVQAVIEKALAFRAKERAKLNEGDEEAHNVGGVVGLNLVFFQAGVAAEGSASGFQMNVIPSTARAGFDIRVPPHVDVVELDREIATWMGEGVTFQFVHKVVLPLVSDMGGAFAETFMRGLGDKRMKEAKVGVFFAATDARFVRERGAPSIGFSPMEKLPVLLHKHDEYVTVEGYMDGIAVYENVIRELGGAFLLDKDVNSVEALEHEEL